MRPEMSHEEAWGELGAAALNALTAEEREAVLAHARTCAKCGPELAALSDVAAQLEYAASPPPWDSARRAALRRRLLARVAADTGRSAPEPAAPEPAAPEATRPAVPTPRARRRWRAVEWFAGAAAVALLTTALLHRIAVRESVEHQAGLTAAQVDSLEREIAERDRILGAITGPGVTVIELRANGRRAASGRMFWDRSTNRWTLFAHHLTTPPAGKAYQLWLITPTAKHSAGVFTPRPNGDAVLAAEYVLDSDSLEAVAVTEEPAGGVAQPTGPVIIAGKPGADRAE